jgi:hypothetical protein
MLLNFRKMILAEEVFRPLGRLKNELSIFYIFIQSYMNLKITTFIYIVKIVI